MKKVYSLIITCLLISTFALSQNAKNYINRSVSQKNKKESGVKGTSIVTNATLYTPSQLVQNVLINGCVQASNITYTGNSSSLGYFSANGANFPFESGIIMCSGNISDAEGPNTESGSGEDMYGGTSDSDLQALIPGYTLHDVTKLEFNFIPSSDTIEFRFIFGSDEYPEFVNSNFNDVFGFFLSGPGITGPYSNNSANIALIPNTTSAVTIDNVNNGTSNNGPCTNCQYYVNNNGGLAIEYDGYTTALTARAIVQHCQTYHIKLAIADAGDGVYDSGVFFEARSFSSGGQVQMNNFSQVGDNSSLYEGCTNYYVFSRLDSTDLSDSVEVILSYSGTAIQGTDISTFPTSFWIPAGQIYDTISYFAYNDGLLEGSETIILTLLSGCPCNMNEITDTIYIYDVEEIKGGINQMQNAYCSQVAPDSIMITASVTIDPNASYVWSTGETGNTIYVPPLPGRNWYNVTISDPCGNDFLDSVPIIIGEFSGINIDVLQPQCNNICNGQINVTPNNGAPPYTYNWIPNGTSTNGLASDLCPGYYKVTVTDSLGCKYFTSTPVVLTNPSPLSATASITTTQTQYCDWNGSPITINAEASPSTVQFLWNTSETTSSINVVPSVGSTTYSVVFQDYCGNTFADSITIKVSNLANPTVTTEDVKCKDQCNGHVNVVPNGGASPYSYTWYPNGTGTVVSGIVATLCDGSYIVTVADVTGCTKTATFDITEPLQLVINPQVVANDSANTCVGIASIDATGGTSPYSYAWANSVTTSTNSGLCQGNYAVTVTDANGCTQQTSVLIINQTGIDDVEFMKFIKIYPNPVTDGSLFIECTDLNNIPESISLMDITGKCILNNKEVSVNSVMTISHLDAGVYSVKIDFKDRTITELIIVN